MLTLYLEGIQDGRRFITRAAHITRQKPIIALKVGRFAGGQRAVASHTGALAGQESAYNAAFRRAGVIRAETSEEMFDWARALAWCPPPSGRRIAVLTNAGGPGVTAADALESNGMHLAEFGLKHSLLCRHSYRQLPACKTRSICLPPPHRKQYAARLKILLEDPGVDGVMVILPPPPLYTAGAVAKAIIPVVHHANKPVVVALMGERLSRRRLNTCAPPRSLNTASQSAPLPPWPHLLSAPNTWRALTMQPQFPEDTATRDRQGVIRLPIWRQIRQDDWLPGSLIENLARCYRLSLPQLTWRALPQEAAELAAKVGFPVVVKDRLPRSSPINPMWMVCWLTYGTRPRPRRDFDQVVEQASRALPQAHLLGAMSNTCCRPGKI